jgi:hypothetical protein
MLTKITKLKQKAKDIKDKSSKFSITVTNGMLSIAIATLFLCIYLMHDQINNSHDSYADERHKVDSLNIAIQGYKEDQLAKDSVINCLKDRVTLLNEGILQEKQKIAKIKKEYGNKIQTISSYTPNELDSFFTSRYN